MPSSASFAGLTWREGFLAILGMGSSLLCVGLVILGHGRLALTLAVLVLLLGATMYSPRTAILCTFAYLSVLGDFRRLFISWWGWSGTDPLILVAPAITVFLVGAALAQKRIRFDTPLSRLVLFLTLIMIAQIFNPKQGGLVVGVAGALFYLIPLLWFWIGRTYLHVSDLNMLFSRVFVPIALLAACLGIYQVYFGYLGYQQQWFEIAGYEALRVRGTFRPIGFFPSSAEFLNYINKAAVVIWGMWLLRRSTLIVAVPLIFFTIFVSGTRGPIVYALLSMTTLWTMLGRSVTQWVPRMAFALAFGVLVLIGGLNGMKNVQVEGPVQMAVDHQIDGLLNPGESTAVSHLRLFQMGVRTGIVQSPLGRGLGSTTMATGKFGGKNKGSSEIDISDMFIALGGAGGILYTLIVGFVFFMVVRYWIHSREPAALYVTGLLVAGFGGWLLGSHYSVTTLIWIGIGVIDRAQRDFFRPVDD